MRQLVTSVLSPGSPLERASGLVAAAAAHLLWCCPSRPTLARSSCHELHTVGRLDRGPSHSLFAGSGTTAGQGGLPAQSAPETGSSTEFRSTGTMHCRSVLAVSVLVALLTCAAATNCPAGLHRCGYSAVLFWVCVLHVRRSWQPPSTTCGTPNRSRHLRRRRPQLLQRHWRQRVAAGPDSRQRPGGVPDPPRASVHALLRVQDM